MKKLLLSALLVAGAASFANAQEATTLWEDDFEWLAPWSAITPAGNTIGTDDPSAKSPSLLEDTIFVNGVSPYAALVEKGYDFKGYHNSGKKERVPGKQIYLQTNYLKFGLTGYQSGIIMPVLDVPANGTVTIAFDFSSQRQGSGKWDPTKIAAFVENNGEVTTYPIETTTPENNAAYAWEPVSVTLEGATVNKDTKITIINVEEQWESSKALRWFMDNLKITATTTTGIAGVEADANAPVEYFNLLGVRVANPENGVYIRRQGNKATKVVIR